MDFDPYSLDPILTEDYQGQCDITFPTPTVPITETNDFERQHLSPDQWCSCCCCESRPTHIECICCREMKNTLSKITKGLCITMEDDFDSLFLTPCVLRHFVHCIRETRGYGVRDAEWTNR